MAVIGSVMTLILTVSGMAEINSTAMKDTLRELVNDPRFAVLDMNIDEATTMMRVALMVMGGLSVVSLVLGIYVLRGHRSSRVALTGLGGLVALLFLFAGPGGWPITAYVGVSIGLLWTAKSRRWFRPPQLLPPVPPPYGGWGAPPPPPPRLR